MSKVSAPGEDFMRYFYAWVEQTDDWIVFTGQTILERSLSQDAAMKLTSFLNSSTYLNTSSSERAKRPERMDFDFDSLYERYPRRIGRKTGIEKLKKTVTSSEKYNLFVQALDNYISMCEGKEDRFILHFSTFANRWADYLPEDAHPSSEPQLSMDDITKMMDN
jgi:hypothetical protein